MDADAYACCAVLTRDQWVWEFLRRNRDYQADYRRFITLWQALETDYGTPPNRDFQRWKQDPRAYGPLPGEAELAAPSGDLCLGEDDRVLLECWIGAKWGFYKFPLDPQRGTPPGPDELSWRPPPVPGPRGADDAYRLDIPFDLSLPLPPQLEAARFRLASRAAELRRQGVAAPMTVENQRARWTRMLRLLDAEAAGEAVTETDALLLREAKAVAYGGYPDILRLADSSPRQA
ncbi:MAG: DUF6499 domain-containing protein [Thiobacillus sp.]|jgi:hypothetical protein|uniref:transcriptional regulator domain-containing protein n=1 Tax=Thiobacillus sp. TaxID=924 RepID=UPI002894D8A1|nr:DUF6499 domain-containing protein [Thiobacillus sp.]MDT3708372.1 DUF6499 domain-containing protein [Thiobacillus sp.]